MHLRNGARHGAAQSHFGANTVIGTTRRIVWGACAATALGVLGFAALRGETSPLPGELVDGGAAVKALRAERAEALEAALEVAGGSEAEAQVARLRAELAEADKAVFEATGDRRAAARAISAFTAVLNPQVLDDESHGRVALHAADLEAFGGDWDEAARLRQVAVDAFTRAGRPDLVAIAQIAPRTAAPER